MAVFLISEETAWADHEIVKNMKTKLGRQGWHFETLAAFKPQTANFSGDVWFNIFLGSDLFILKDCIDYILRVKMRESILHTVKFR